MLFSLTLTLAVPAHAGLSLPFTKENKKPYELPPDEQSNVEKKSGKKGISASVFSKLNLNGIARGLSSSYTFLKSDTGKELLKVGVPLAIVLTCGGYHVNQLNHKMDRLESRPTVPAYDDTQVFNKQAQVLQVVRNQNFATQQDVQNAIANLATAQNVIDQRAHVDARFDTVDRAITQLDGKVDNINRSIANLTQTLIDKGLGLQQYESQEALQDQIQKYCAIPGDTFKVRLEMVLVGKTEAVVTRVLTVNVLKKDDGNFRSGSYQGSWNTHQQTIMNYANICGSGTYMTVVDADGSQIHSETIE